MENNLPGFITARKAKFNRHGLTRYISADVKLAVRQSSGFGCVVCGSGIIDYEHIDPEFKDAKEHNPNGITLLCVNCHAKKTRNFWPPEVIKDAMKNPKCLQEGYVKEEDLFYVGKGHPTIVFAGSEFRKTLYPIVIGGIPLIAINPPEVNGERFTISANFYNSQGKPSLQIDKNVWLIGVENWDVITQGGTLIIKHKKGNIHLSMRSEGTDKIIIDKFYSKMGGHLIEGDQHQLVIKHLTSGSKYEIRNCINSRCKIGISLG